MFVSGQYWHDSEILGKKNLTAKNKIVNAAGFSPYEENIQDRWSVF